MIIAPALLLTIEAMQENLEGLEMHDLQILLINKNREFTDAMKMGKKHKELLPIYEGIKAIYSAITTHKKPRSMAPA